MTKITIVTIRVVITKKTELSYSNLDLTQYWWIRVRRSCLQIDLCSMARLWHQQQKNPWNRPCPVLFVKLKIRWECKEHFSWGTIYWQTTQIWLSVHSLDSVPFILTSRVYNVFQPTLKGHCLLSSINDIKDDMLFGWVF